VIGGGNRASLELRIRAAVTASARRILSIGICGALSPLLRIGDCIVATEIVDGDQRWLTDAQWTNELLGHLPQAQRGALSASDTIIVDPGEKLQLHRATGAVAIDMESHIVASLALEHCLPFAAVRIVSDLQTQSLPPAALVAMLPSGKVNIAAVIRSVVSKPRQIPALIRTAWEAE
jgi:nucleoside phosphorylase